MSTTEKSKEPTGKERLRRRASSNLNLRPKRFESNVKKAYSKEQLAEIAAIILTWNQIEDYINFLLQVVFFGSLCWEMQTEIFNGLRGIHRKIALLRSAYKGNNILNDKAKDTIEIALQGVLDCNIYRNGFTHSRAFDHNQGIARYVDDSNKVWEILVKEEALTNFYDEIVCLQQELAKLAHLYRATNGHGVTVLKEGSDEPEPDQVKALRERVIPNIVEEIQHYQFSRSILTKKRPEFPDKHLIISQDNVEDFEN